MSLKSPKTAKRKTSATALVARRVAKKTGVVRTALHITPSSASKKPPVKKLSAKSIVIVHFGSVSMQVTEPSRAKVKANVEAGASALQRARDRLLHGGISITHKEGVPLFRADPDVPNQLVREMNGKLTYGTFVNGKFKPST